MVWYACYGSNLDAQRFMCYLQGGRYPGNQKEYHGTRDTSAFQATVAYQIPNALYFAKEAHIWGGGGVCFIENSSSKAQTLARLYLITAGQFSDLHAQECNQAPGALVDLEQAAQTGSVDLYPEKWYGRVLHLGQEQGQDIFTFTNVADLSDSQAPAPNYLKSLMRGLAHSHGLKPKEQAEYFAQKRGVAGHWSTEALEKLCTEALS